MARGGSRYNMNKLVDRLKEHGYTVRFEKGNFQSGYCILEDRRVVVINKFLDIDMRIENLRSILGRVISEEAVVASA